MTGSEGTACADLPRLIKSVRHAGKDRKLRLFACGCARIAWDRMRLDPGRSSVELAERFADGEASGAELAEAQRIAYGVWAWGQSGGGTAGFFVVGGSVVLREASAAALDTSRLVPVAIVPHGTPRRRRAVAALREAELALSRCVLGGPGQPPTLTRRWPPPEAAALAQAAYQHRALPSGHLDPARLAVLSDALEEGGCCDADLLAHLRSPGPHVRGCWAVDVVLNRQ
jgi:hypothetical protein